MLTFEKDIDKIKEMLEGAGAEIRETVEVPFFSAGVPCGIPSVIGEVKGRADAERGTADAPRIEFSELGSAIFREEICKISRFYPQVEVWKVCVMPDHLHMIVRVKEDLPPGKHLGQVVKGFKTGCSRAWWAISSPSGKTEGTVVTVPSVSPEGYRPVLFEKGYNDKILMREGAA